MTTPQLVDRAEEMPVATGLRSSGRQDFPAVLAPDDATLIAQMSAGGRLALEPFYARSEKTVRAAVFLRATDSLNVDMVVEDVFWQAWCRAQSFDARKESAKDWLLNITRSVCLDRCRVLKPADDRYGAW